MATNVLHFVSLHTFLRAKNRLQQDGINETQEYWSGQYERKDHHY